MEERLVKRLMTSMKCDACGQNYEVRNVHVLGHREDLWFLRVLCSACHTQALVAAMVKESRASEAAAYPVEAELVKTSGEAIGADDVLEMHEFLKDFDGDFARLFGEK